MKNLIFILFTVSLVGYQHAAKEYTFHGKTAEKLWKQEEREFLIKGLERTKSELLDEIGNLTDGQWNFKEEEKRWSIREIVEHLKVQDELYYREIYLVCRTLQSSKYLEIVKGKDEEFLKYATDPTQGNAGWNLEPIGRFCTKEKSEEAFIK